MERSKRNRDQRAPGEHPDQRRRDPKAGKHNGDDRQQPDDSLGPKAQGSVYLRCHCAPPLVCFGSLLATLCSPSSRAYASQHRYPGSIFTMFVAIVGALSSFACTMLFVQFDQLVTRRRLSWRTSRVLPQRNGPRSWKARCWLGWRRHSSRTEWLVGLDERGFCQQFGAGSSEGADAGSSELVKAVVAEYETSEGRSAVQEALRKRFAGQFPPGLTVAMV